MFFTVFSESSGLDLSGVEIAATGFANLLEDFHVEPLNMAALALCYFFGCWNRYCVSTRAGSSFHIIGNWAFNRISNRCVKSF